MVFPVNYEEGEETIMAYKKAADEAGLTIADDMEYVESCRYVQKRLSDEKSSCD